MAFGAGRFWSRGFRFVFGALLIVALCLGLGTLVPRPFFAPHPVLASASQPAIPTRTVLLLSSAIHSDLALPASPDVLARFSFMAADGLNPAQSGVEYIVAGWGGRSFYVATPTWSDLKPGPVLKALSLDHSVMHMGLAGAIDLAHPSVRVIQLDEASYQRLMKSVLASFSVGADDLPVVVAGAQYGDFDLFYEAEGWFNAFVGCNVWTARMLRQAGLTTGWWTPLPGLLTASLTLHNASNRFGYEPAAR